MKMRKVMLVLYLYFKGEFLVLSPAPLLRKKEYGTGPWPQGQVAQTGSDPNYVGLPSSRENVLEKIN